MSKEFQKNFGRKIKEIRRERGYTQERLAEMAEISPRQLTRIETGSNFPKSETIEKLCRCLKIDPKGLFNFSAKEEYEEISTGTNGTQIISVSIKNDVMDFSGQITNHKTPKEDDKTEKLYKLLLEEIKELEFDKNKLEFILLAKKSLEDKENFEKLKACIKGIELAAELQ